MSRQSWVVLAAVVLLGAAAPVKGEQPVKADVVLKGGTVVDGTGAPGRKADVAIRGDRIVAVGTFEVEPGAKVIDATGLIVAPGFIDLHTHSDPGIAQPRTRANRNYQAQGVTTIVTGNCGGGVLDVGKYLDSIDEHGAGTNVIHLIPHGTLRASIFGNAERPPSTDELEKMKALVEKGMKAGAWGMSTGLIYLPGRYAKADELIELAKVIARFGGIYASHIRNEGTGLLRSIDEAIAIGRGAGLPVHVSHLKASGKAAWGLTRAACERIAEERKAGLAITADQYPYVASSTKLAAMVVPHWAIQGTAEDFARIADDPEQGARLRRETQEALDKRDGGASLRIARHAPRTSRVGRDLVAIAKDEGTTPLEVVIDIQRHGGAQVISFGMSEDDVRDVMRHDWVATASDGSSHLPGGQDRPHPRSYGTFPRKLRYALDDRVITLEQAVRSCSGLPAEILRLPDRGMIRPGAFADVVVFDPATFRDAATFDHPTRYAQGVAHLFVNGKAVIAQGEPQEALPGRALRLAKDGPADMILKLGRIWTGDPARPWAEALAARGGAVAAVGTAEEVERFRGPNTRVVDRPGAFATPGLIDAHGHLTDLGQTAEQVDLRGVKTPGEVARLVRAWAEAHPGDSWVLGQSWDQSLWPDNAFPTAAVLDAVTPDRPVWLERVDGHAAWANSEAMRRAGISRDTAAPPDGQILRDGDGRPTGVLIDGAMRIAYRAMPAPSRSDYERQILTAQDLVLKEGLTSIHSAGVYPREAEAYRELDRSGRLKVRVYGMAKPPKGREAEFARRPPQPSSPGARFEMRTIKLFIDGAMGSRGGLLFEPYSDDPGNSGLLLIKPETLAETTTEALRHGWQMATHAIGDRGNALVLDAFEAARKVVPEAADPRLRIEHAQVVRKEDVPRFAALGVIASMQPSHAIDDMRWADARLGPDRAGGPTPGAGSSTRACASPSAATSPSRSSTRSTGSTPRSPARTSRAVPPAAGTPTRG